MNKDRFCVGIDVGKEELIVVAGSGKSRSFGTTVAEIKRLSQWLLHHAGDQAIHVGMEATGVYSHGVAAGLSQDERITVSVINPAQIKAFGRAMLTRTKTDRVDAKVIREFVRSQSPAPWTPPPVIRQQLYALVSQADALGQEIQQWKNRRHAQHHDINIPKAVTTSTAAIIRSLERAQARLHKAIEDVCASAPMLTTDMSLMTSIKGIGVRSAAQILAYGSTSLTERTRCQLDAHAGLVPAERQSGTSVRGKSHLAKQGNARLRKALYMPTLVAVHHNPVLKRHYEKLLARGKMKKVALIACMRKLLNIIRAILISKKSFDPNYQTLT
ncbi:MAG: IS110 family transposase [Candidatus Zixiibacteriota bacterium]